MDSSFVTERLEATCRTFETLERQLADPSVAADPEQLLKLARERARLEPLVLDYRRQQDLQEQQQQAQQLLRESRGDSELEALANEELRSLEEQLEELQQRLRIALLPRDPRDERSVMLEIRAGAGGDEASLWAGDLARMYERHAQSVGWQVEPVSASEAELGGSRNSFWRFAVMPSSASSSTKRACIGCSGYRPLNPRAACTPPPPPWR